MTHTWMACLVVAGVLASDRPAPGPPSAAGATAFVNVTLVAVESGTLVPGQTVVVEGGRIRWVGPAREARIPAGATRIDGTGRFLAPGLADMHAHVDPDAMVLYLASGITTVRELNGDSTRLRLRDDLAAGRQAGPTLIVSGPLMAGQPQRYRHLQVTGVPQAEQEVARLAREGYDLVKVYDGLGLEVYQAIVRTAKTAGLPVTGHIPRAVGLDSALAARQDIEHAATILDAAGGHSADTLQLDAALDRVAAANVWVTPTLAAFEALTLTGSPEVWARFDGPDLALVDRDTRSWWRSLRRGDSAPGASPRNRQHWAMLQRVVRGLADRQVRMLAGTDTPNPLMVPGTSLHEELRVLEQAGVSRRAVLAMATMRAAEYLGTPEEFGSIRPGARADLLLLAANPLENLAALRTPEGVMARGRWMPRAELAGLVAEVARRYR